MSLTLRSKARKNFMFFELRLKNTGFVEIFDIVKGFVDEKLNNL